MLHIVSSCGLIFQCLPMSENMRCLCSCCCIFFFFQAEDGIRDLTVTGVQTCALPISDVGRPPSPPQAEALAVRLDELELSLRRELEAAGFRADDPRPAQAWAAFRRALALPLDDEAGPFARAVLVGGLHRLTFGRRLRPDEDGRSWALEFRFTRT